ncbi:MAG: outer membrane beta-barrel protein [Niabella sp.]
MKIFFCALIVFISGVELLQAQVVPPPDTLEIGGVVVIRDNNDTVYSEPKRTLFKKFNTMITPKKVTTEYLTLDLGFSGFKDATDYTSDAAQAYAPGSNENWFEIRPFKSRNVNLWLVSQKMSLIGDIMYLKYSLGWEFNNYRYKQPIRYDAEAPDLADAPVVSLDESVTRKYRKNKLATDYLTVPVLLNFNLTPNRLYNFSVSAGVSAGYLTGSRNKVKTSDEGKQKARDDFDLNHWKLSYVGDITLGVITLYGSYAFKSMYSRGLDMTPYNVGVRIRPMGLLNKLETP